MPSVVITEFMDQPAVDALSATFAVHYDPTLVDDPTRLQAAVAQADAVIVRNRTQVNAELLAAAPKCRVVGRLGVGLDNIDLTACQLRGVMVIPATGANARAVAEYVLAATLVLLRGCFMASASVGEGKWPRLAYSSGLEIRGRIMGVVGFGSIGRLVSDLVRPLGMRVLAFDPALSPTDQAFTVHHAQHCARLDDLLQQADAISLHVPLNDQTRHLINAQRIALMKPTAVLVNTARGGVIDEAALVEAIRDKKLGGAALDVFEREPLPSGVLPHDLPQLILTPHIAGLTQEANERVSTMIAERVTAALKQ